VKDPAAQPVERGLLGQIFLVNYPLKLLSLGIAVVLFSLVHSDQDAQRSMYIDVVVLPPPRKTEKVLVSALPAQVKVTLRGPRSRIAALQHDDFAPLQMDLRDTTRRVYTFDQSAIDVSGPVQVVSIEPSSVELIWRTRSEHKVPVRLKVHGTPEAGYMVKKPAVIAPASVTVSGPSDELAALTEVSTEDIAVDGMTEGVQERRVQLQQLSGHLAYVEANSVAVHLEIVPEQSERTLHRLDVAVLGAGEAVLRPSEVTVTLQGPSRGLNEIEVDQIVPYVELPSTPVGAGVEVLEVKLRGVPEGFTATRIAPTSVIARRIR
jgi:YbbR domain-containing protein